MARYIKVNKKVAQYLHLENDRNKVKDGNYLLWQADILPFGKLTNLSAILQQIGAIALQAHEAREEQDGVINRELPIASDAQFIIDSDENNIEQELYANSEQSNEDQQTAIEEV